MFNWLKRPPKPKAPGDHTALWERIHGLEEHVRVDHAALWERIRGLEEQVRVLRATHSENERTTDQEFGRLRAQLNEVEERAKLAHESPCDKLSQFLVGQRALINDVFGSKTCVCDPPEEKEELPEQFCVTPPPPPPTSCFGQAGKRNRERKPARREDPLEPLSHGCSGPINPLCDRPDEEFNCRPDGYKEGVEQSNEEDDFLLTPLEDAPDPNARPDSPCGDLPHPDSHPPKPRPHADHDSWQ